MNENAPTEENPKRPEPDGAKRLLRSWDDRVLAGVCGGLGRYFKIDPILFRIGFAVAALTGIGILAYLALYVFVPSDDGWGNPVPQTGSGRIFAAVAALLLVIFIPGGFIPFADAGWWWGLIGFAFWISVLAALGYVIYRVLSGGGDGEPWTVARVATLVGVTIVALILAGFFALASAWATAAGGDIAIASLVILAGILLAAAAFRRPARWLIVPALALVLPMAAVKASGFELVGIYGEREVAPATAVAIPAEGYELAAGDLTVDLRQLDWDNTTRIELPIEAGLGRASVIVPPRVCVSADLEARIGMLEVRGDRVQGADIDQYTRAVPGSEPELSVTGSIDAGVIEVVTEHPDLRDRSGHSLPDDEPQPERCTERGPR